MRRWLDIVFLTATVLIIGLLFQTPLLKVLKTVTNYSASLHHIAWSAVVFFIFALLTVVLIRLGALNAQFRIGTMVRYPPCWTSSILVFIFLIVWAVSDTGRVSLVQAGQILSQLANKIYLIALGILLGFEYQYLELFRASPQSAIVSKPDMADENRNIFDDDAYLLSWIMEEKPIRHPNQDMFGRALAARRVAKILGGKTVGSVGVVGPYGSGKSSFVNLVEYYLSNPESVPNSEQPHQYRGQFILCRVDGWGRVSGTVAQKILHSAIEKMKLYVDCTSIIALPENYRNAIAGTASVGGAAISALLQSSQDPVTQLCRLDNILAAANIRLIIVLEDLDRNVNDSIIRDEIPALLDRLRVLSNVSFLLAIGAERHLSDIILRICDDVEAIA